MIEVEQINQVLPFRSYPNNVSVLIDLNVIGEGGSSGVQEKNLRRLETIASQATVDEILVIGLPTGLNGLGREMIGRKRVATIRIPSLAFETIDASELEFIPKKRLVPSIIWVADWTVPTDVGTLRILEWVREFHCWS